MKKSAWGFLTPFLLLFIVFMVCPMIYSFYISLFASDMGTLHFVGLKNYETALHNTGFWKSFLRVLYYGILQQVIMLGSAIFLALVLDTPYVKGKSFFRLVYFLPYAVPGIFAAIMWGFLYSKQLDPIIQAIGFQPLSTGVLIYSILNITVWEWVGYNMTIYVASLTGQSRDLFEAAKIDGCGEWSLALHVKLPLLGPTIGMTLLLSMIGSVQLFNEPFILKNLVAISPTYTPNITVYNTAINIANEPYGAALAVILGVITIGCTLFVMLIVSIIKKYKQKNQYYDIDEFESSRETVNY